MTWSCAKAQIGYPELCKCDGECQNIWNVGEVNENDNENDAAYSENEKEIVDMIY